MVKRIYKVGTVSKGRFRSKMQSGTGFNSKAKAQVAKKFFQKTTSKKVVIRKT